MSLRQRVTTTATTSRTAAEASYGDRAAWNSKPSSSAELYPDTSRKRVKKSRSTIVYLSSPILPWISLGVGMLWIMAVYIQPHRHEHTGTKLYHDKIHVPLHSFPYQAMRGGRKLMQHDQRFMAVQNNTLKTSLKLPRIELSNENSHLISSNNQNYINNSVTIRERLIQLEEDGSRSAEKLALLKAIRSSQRNHIQSISPVTKSIAQHTDVAIPTLASNKTLDKLSKQTASVIEATFNAEDWSGTCQAQAQQAIEEASKSPEASIEWMETLTKCATKDLTDVLVQFNKDISFESRSRLAIAYKLENYTCVDPHAPISPDLSSHIWHHTDGEARLVHVKHNRPSSQIHVIENFIHTDECIAMEEAAKRHLHQATVADGKGGSRLSDHRKAMQAGIRVPWSEESKGNPIARLSRRVYDYTNQVLGLNIDEHGQEDLMSIQYFGRGKEDEHPDRYMPHCDGDCSGLKHHNGTRMATVVVYCTVPTLGGATNFHNADVYVQPVVGNAVFFSYMDPITRTTDSRFTEHSGCPVFEGEKKIVTQWIRLGVDRENPWDSFNTLGIKMKDAKAYE